MASYDYDLFVIGAGSGGVRASRMSAGFGARVAVAESSDMGGTCVNLGCIPKKLLVYASHFRDDVACAIDGYGWTVGDTSFDWPTFIGNKNQEIARLNLIYQGVLDNAGVDILRGRAHLVDRHTVQVAGKRHTAKYILVATGSRPFMPPEVEGIEHAISSDQAFHLPDQPRRVLVLGGGYIAVEFTCIFHGLGTEVTQAYRGPLFLRGFDDDARQHLAGEMMKKGMDVRFDLVAKRIEKAEAGLHVTLSDGTSMEVDQVLAATGRKPNTAGLGLEEIGVELGESGEIVVDAYSKSSVDSVYAIGDVTDRVNLTPVALHEGNCIASTLFNDHPMTPDHENVPAAVFSQPPMGTVGLTETQARERYGDVVVYRSKFRALRETMTSSQAQTLMKLIVDRASDRVVGLHMVGPEAGEITQGFAVAIHAGLTKTQFDATIGIHPTAAEEFVTMRDPVE
jgi:glutathione reductase (NADPH)